ncbi:MAG: hypothetical protein HC871_16750 [Rhizobiales bacterium]|nr:hypothetical protein [Hyphomicrobiales bacterium]
MPGPCLHPRQGCPEHGSRGGGERAPEAEGVDLRDALGQAPKPYRERALIALLANERRAIDQRIEQVTDELDRLAASGASGERAEVQAALTALQQELIVLEQRLDEVALEHADVGPGQSPGAAGGPAVFIPASKPRVPETALAAASDRPSREVRRQIQEALVFLGGYDSSLDGDFGARTQAAIRRYQASIDAETTGLLGADQVADLLEAAAVRREESGLRPLADERIGFRLRYPGALLTKEGPADGGYRLLSDERGLARLQVVEIDSRDLRTVFDDLTRHLKEGYRHFGKSWFVVSGEVDGDMFYSMGRSSGGRTVIAHLTYPTGERDLWDPFSVFLYNSFELAEKG